MNDLFTGTVTFLFTDIEGSTRLLQQLGREYVSVLEKQQQLLRSAFEDHHGRIIDTQGDSFFVAFPRASDAVSAAIAAQRDLSRFPWPEDGTVRVRMASWRMRFSKLKKDSRSYIS